MFTKIKSFFSAIGAFFSHLFRLGKKDAPLVKAVTKDVVAGAGAVVTDISAATSKVETDVQAK